VVAWVCYHIYLSLGKIQDQAQKQMGDNVSFSRDGMRVSVKHMENESYLDRTQSWVVKAWELGSSPGANGQGDAGKRKRYACHRTLGLSIITDWRAELS